MKVESWGMFLFLLSLIAAWSMLILGVTRWILSRSLADLKDKLTAMGRIDSDLRHLEREVMEMKATLPLDYVRKEDHVRFELVLNTKIDRLHQDMMTLNTKENCR